MTNTTQKPAPCGTSDNYWNKRFESNTGKTGTGYGDTKSNWNVRFDKGKTPVYSNNRKYDHP